ncbi:MAG: SDR family NAD(P)-dependent oxidoreductase [Halieaceae bacterium]|nr:SDR family NAD(P)-dependent oxidoreductase [Halieaceae bacterium]
MSNVFGADSTAEEVISGINLGGKTAVVTGGSAGLGVETGRVLAGAGAEVVMVGRDNAKLSAVVDELRRQLPAARIEKELMDLADLASIREAANRILQRWPRLHLLINNAGVMACPEERTRDGFELQFGTNHLGHFLFTCLLVRALRAAAPTRIVNLSSGGHKISGVDFDDPNFERREYDKWVAYGQSKTANSLFSVALNQRLAQNGVTAYAVHPGVIVTELGRYLQPADIEAIFSRSGRTRPTPKSVAQGAATTVWAATATELEGRGGLYLEDCQIAAPTSDESASKGVVAHARDAATAQQLWELSEQLLGEQFDLAG